MEETQSLETLDHTTLSDSDMISESKMPEIGAMEYYPSIDYKPTLRNAEWKLVYSDGNKIRMFQYDTLIGGQWRSIDRYIIALDLAEGAKLIPYQEPIQSISSSENPSPQFRGKRVENFDLARNGWIGIVNSGFYGLKNQSAFLLRQNHQLISSGYATFAEADNHQDGPRRTLVVRNNWAYVDHLPSGGLSFDPGMSESQRNQRLYRATSNMYRRAEMAVTGLDPLNQKRNSYYPKVARTFLGVRLKKFVQNDSQSFIYLFVTSGKYGLNQKAAHNVLQSFACASEDIIMFDGGGSTQLKWGNEVKVQALQNRYVPFFFAIK